MTEQQLIDSLTEELEKKLEIHEFPPKKISVRSVVTIVVEILKRTPLEIR